MHHLPGSFWVALLVAALTAGAYTAELTLNKRAVRIVATAMNALLTIALLLMLIERAVHAGRPPFRTLYESLVLFAACVSLTALMVERWYRLPLLGLTAASLVAGLLGYAALRADIDLVTLPAALRSAWFIPHVAVYFIGYGALALSTVTAAASLLQPHKRITLTSLRAASSTSDASNSRSVTNDQLMHAQVKLGYAFITIGLVIGAVWAQTAWGTYWGWDPKENWSLVTFLIYTAYLHLRLQPRWSRRKAAIMVILGFAAVLITYLGVNLLPTVRQSGHLFQP